MSNLLLTYTRREVTNIMMEDFFSKMTGENDPDVSLRAIPSCDLSAEDIAWSDIILAVFSFVFAYFLILSITK